MPRKKTPVTHVGPDWFLIEWMRYYKKTQRQMAEAIDVSESTMSDICKGRTGYYRALVNDLARALNIEPYELLMHPDKAHRFRRYDEAVLSVASEKKIDYRPLLPDDIADAKRPARK